MKETSQKRTVTVEGEKVVQFTPRYSLHEFLQGRENQEVYEVFMTKFAWCVVARKTEWQSRVLAAETDRDVLSVSDEAFALIVLENNWSRWIDVFNINGGKVPKNGVGRKTGENVSLVPTKYTRGGLAYVFRNHCSNPLKDDGSAYKYKGWSAAGITRYNALHDQVKEDRKIYKEFITQWLEKICQEYKNPSKKRRMKVNMPEARNDLFSDGETEDEDIAQEESSIKHMNDENHRAGVATTKENNNHNQYGQEEEEDDGSNASVTSSTTDDDE